MNRIEKKILKNAEREKWIFKKYPFSRPISVMERYPLRVIFSRACLFGVVGIFITLAMTLIIFAFIGHFNDGIKFSTLLSQWYLNLNYLILTGYVLGFVAMFTIEMIIALAWNRRRQQLKKGQGDFSIS